jgi:hypothetical protein
VGESWHRTSRQIRVTWQKTEDPFL